MEVHGAEPVTAPRGAWSWSQRWHDLLFLHWRVPVSFVQSRLPSELEIDTWEGWAWLSVVIFRLKVRPRWLPFVPVLSSMTEVNLRTYVRRAGRPGICFLSLHADNYWAIRLARLLTPLPYFFSRLSYQRSGSSFHFEGGKESSNCQLSITFRPIGACREPEDGSLDAWLLERYRAFAESRHGMLEAEVSHPRWSVQEVAVAGGAIPEGPWWGLDLARPPDVLHFSPGFQAFFGPFRPCAGLCQQMP
jgi:uncharacterized protein